MRTHVTLALPHRRTPTARQVVRPLAHPIIRAVAMPVAKAVARRTPLARSDVSVPRRIGPAVPPPLPYWTSFQLDPYVDYGRVLTSEGGILIIYKDLDLRWRHRIWRAFAWTAATGIEGWHLLHESPLHSLWINLACLLAVAAANWWITSRPVEVYRHIEIRPDCMILEGYDVFWVRYMEGGLPSFEANEEGHQVLCGIYGTRWIEYLTVRSFDDFDRTPDVMAVHLDEAMQQLWVGSDT